VVFNILVVDDSLPMRKVIKKNIKASGFSEANIDEASDGSEAMRILNEKWIHLMMTGYNMPNMNGLELIAGMKENETLKSIPVVVITAEGSQARFNQFMERGVSGYIRKPFTPEMIRREIRGILGGER
jgi:two-component system chemotaxis response regulator CheY